VLGPLETHVVRVGVTRQKRSTWLQYGLLKLLIVHAALPQFGQIGFEELSGREQMPHFGGDGCQNLKGMFPLVEKTRQLSDRSISVTVSDGSRQIEDPSLSLFRKDRFHILRSN
jgi:hypothetical protein